LQYAEPPSVVEDNKQEDVEPMLSECNPEPQSESRLTAGGSDETQEAISPKSLKDAVKPKHKIKKKQHSKS
jgi:exosome complex component RRP45